MSRPGQISATTSGYVRAAGRLAPVALYDPVVALTMRERTFRARLLAQVLDGGRPERPLEVVDVGCGTGTFAVALARAGAAAARVTAIDGDAPTLALARRKDRDGLVTWQSGTADALPLADGAADRVVLSLLLHHLAPATQAAALREARRVLRPGGRLHVADWGPPARRDLPMRLAFLALQAIDGRACTAPLGRGELPGMLGAAGFARVALHDRLRTGWGVLELRSAHVPA